ncbi:hypothetical protein KCU69_g61, partial [Aureobasidium melanogenum]
MSVQSRRSFSNFLRKARVLLQSLTDEATESSPPVGGTAGISCSLSRDLSVFNFIFPSAGFAFLTLTILLSSPSAPSIPSALSSSSIPSHSSSLFSSSSGKASASESKAVFSFFPGRRRFRGFFCDFSMREIRVSCFSARLPAFVFADEVLTSGAVVAGREAAATLARIVVRFLPLVGACKTSVKPQWEDLSGAKGCGWRCQGERCAVNVEVAAAKVVSVATSQKSPTLMGLVCAREHWKTAQRIFLKHTEICTIIEVYYSEFRCDNRLDIKTLTKTPATLSSMVGRYNKVTKTSSRIKCHKTCLSRVSQTKNDGTRCHDADKHSRNTFAV